MTPKHRSHNTNNLDKFVNVENIDLLSVHLGDDTVLLARKKDSVGMGLSTPSDSEGTGAHLLVRIVIYIPEKAMSMWSCLELDNMGISTLFCQEVYIGRSRRTEQRPWGASLNNNIVYALRAKVL